MNAQQLKVLKRLIKEAVVDAIHEELPFILEEHMARQEKQALRENRTFNFSSNDVPSGLPSDVRQSLAAKMGLTPPPTGLQVDMSGNGNPLAAFIADVAANMTPQERSGLSNLG